MPDHPPHQQATPPEPATAVLRIGPPDIPLMRELLALFAVVFDEPQTYAARVPRAGYLATLLAKDHFIALVATANGAVVGGLAAYELQKFEQERSEIYIYDLAVAEDFRRRGIATSLIDELVRIAASRGAYVVFVQADRGDEPAITLYSKLGRREDVLHFDIAVTKAGPARPR